jgi:hypothetical protein
VFSAAFSCSRGISAASTFCPKQCEQCSVVKVWGLTKENELLDKIPFSRVCDFSCVPHDSTERRQKANECSSASPYRFALEVKGESGQVLKMKVLQLNHINS